MTGFRGGRRGEASLRLVLDPEVDHENILKDGAKNFSESFVFGVNEISVPVFVALERENPAVGEAFVMLFGADIGAPLEGDDLRDLFLQGTEGLFDFLDVIGRGCVLKLEGDHVVEPLGGAGVAGDSGEEDGAEE